MEAIRSVALIAHLLAFAAWAGGAVAQRRLMQISARSGVAPLIRDTYERNAAAIIVRLELPAALLSIASGLALLWFRPGYLHYPAMHVKWTLVLFLLILTHLEMFNARKIVRLREGKGSEGEIAGRKGRHAAYGSIGGLLLLGVLVCVAFFLRG